MAEFKWNCKLRLSLALDVSLKRGVDRGLDRRLRRLLRIGLLVWSVFVTEGGSIPLEGERQTEESSGFTHGKPRAPLLARTVIRPAAERTHAVEEGARLM